MIFDLFLQAMSSNKLFNSKIIEGSFVYATLETKHGAFMLPELFSSKLFEF